MSIARQLVLSLFPGIDLLGRAFEECGFCVVRGPDVIFGGDIRGWRVPSGRFDGVIGGPPCQAFSKMQNINKARGREPSFGNLIPEFERIVNESHAEWFLMENVPEAPTPFVSGYGVWRGMLDNRQLGETQQRLRAWTFGRKGQRDVPPLLIDTVALFNPVFEGAAIGHATSWSKVNGRSEGSMSEKHFAILKRKQGLPKEFDLPGWTVAGKCKAVGNGVPMAMGRAMAKAVLEALEATEHV